MSLESTGMNLIESIRIENTGLNQLNQVVGGNYICFIIETYLKIQASETSIELAEQCFPGLYKH